MAQKKKKIYEFFKFPKKKQKKKTTFTIFLVPKKKVKKRTHQFLVYSDQLGPIAVDDVHNGQEKAIALASIDVRHHTKI